LRQELFGGVVFMKTKFVCYLNKFGFQLLEKLDTEESYTDSKIRKRFFGNNFDPRIFLERMFNRGVFTSYN